MPSESEIFDAVFSFSSDSELPSTLAVYDGDHEYEPRDVTNQSRHPSQATLNRVHSLEPPEFDSELPATPSEEMDASFQAALQLLDDFNVDFSSETLHATAYANLNGDTSSTSASDPEDSSVSFTNAPISSKQVPTSKPRRRHRISTKQQVDNLRGTIGELTKQLDSMRTGSSQAEVVDTKTQSSEVASMWQDIAARQLARRQEAESDNAKLRVMLDLQVQEAKNLKRILKRRTRIDMLEEMLGVKRHKLLESEKPESSITVLQEMLQSVDEFYIKVDNEFANKKMDLVQCPGKRRTANRLATNGVMLEILQKQLVPFQAKMTEKAVWAALGKIAMQPLQCIKDLNAHVDFYGQTLEQSEDTMMISYTATTAGVQGSDVRLIRIRKVMRKYAEADRTVFICRIQTQPHHSSQKTGISLRCGICVVVENPKVPTGEVQATAIKSYYSVSRHVPRNEEYQSHANVDMAITVWDETIARVSSEIESFLLDAKVCSKVLEN